jgi:transposase-like protein
VSLAAFAWRPLQEPFPYLVLDACHKKVRGAGIVMSQAVLIASASMPTPYRDRRDGQPREPLDLERLPRRP